MTGIAPEPTDRSVARVYAGGLPDAPADIAKALAEVLNRAGAADLSVVPRVSGDTPGEIRYAVEDAHGRPWAEVECDASTGTWHAAADPAT